MMGDSDVPEDPADPSGWLGARGFRWGPEGPGPYLGVGAVAPSDAGHCITHPLSD